MVNEYCSRGGVLSLRFKARSSSSVASAIEVDLFLRNPIVAFNVCVELVMD